MALVLFLKTSILLVSGKESGFFFCGISMLMLCIWYMSFEIALLNIPLLILYCIKFLTYYYFHLKIYIEYC